MKLTFSLLHDIKVYEIQVELPGNKYDPTTTSRAFFLLQRMISCLNSTFPSHVLSFLSFFFVFETHECFVALTTLFSDGPLSVVFANSILLPPGYVFP